MDNQFQPGDIVQLKSGGPKMTVEGQNPTFGDIICKWFEGTKLQEGRFEATSLKKENNSEDIGSHTTDSFVD